MPRLMWGTSLPYLKQNQKAAHLAFSIPLYAHHLAQHQRLSHPDIRPSSNLHRSSIHMFCSYPDVLKCFLKPAVTIFHRGVLYSLFVEPISNCLPPRIHSPLLPGVFDRLDFVIIVYSNKSAVICM